MNKIEELLEQLDDYATDCDSYSLGLPLGNKADKAILKGMISDFCWKLAWDASEVEIGEDFQEWFDNYIEPKPITEKIKVTISTLKQFNWNSVYNLAGIDYNVLDDIHIVELDKEIFQKLFK